MTQLLKMVPLENQCQAEIYTEKKIKKSINWADTKPSFQVMSLDDGLCLRVLTEKGAQGIVTCKGGAEAKIPALAQRAIEIANGSPPDRHRQFFNGQKKSSPALPVDESVFQSSSDEISQMLSKLEKIILSLDPRIKKIIKLNYIEEKSSTCLANSYGVELGSGGSSFGLVVEVLAEDQGQAEVGWDYQFCRFKKDLDLEHVVRGVARHTVQSLGGTPIASGRYAVVLHPRVGTQLLSLVIEALSAEAVQLGRSFWRNKKGESVSSSLVNLMDDPTLPAGLASSTFDDEGVPQSGLAMVTNGILQDYFYDLYSSSKDHRESNGRAQKASLGALPKPGATNFYLKPGHVKKETLLAGAEKTFYLHDVMGLHMADPITGEFSLGASGVLYEKGKFTKAVRGVTVAGTVGEFLKNVIGVGDDLTWYGSIGAPSILVDQIMVAGI